MMEGAEADAEEKRRPTESLAQEVQTRVVEAFEVKTSYNKGFKIFWTNFRHLFPLHAALVPCCTFNL